MSFLHLTCPWCHADYTAGVVGSTMIGSGAMRLPISTRVKSLPWQPGDDVQKHSDEEMASAQFRCGNHIKDREVLLCGGAK